MPRLGRLCTRPEHNVIASGPRFPGIDRIEAHFFGEAFTPHRHDTYALGVTLYGVQTFRYRRELRYSTPGKVIVIHPDELHDGGAGTDDGLRYRMLYLEPTLLRQALPPSMELPFLSEPVVSDAVLLRTLLIALEDLRTELEELAVDQLVANIAACLSRYTRSSRLAKSTIDTRRMNLARDYLAANANRTISSKELETTVGLNRFEIARQFRRLFGTSPHRFLIMRRLARARNFIERGLPLAEIAIEIGFADQSHLNRQFKKAFGMTPGRWQLLTRHETEADSLRTLQAVKAPRGPKPI